MSQGPTAAACVYTTPVTGFNQPLLPFVQQGGLIDITSLGANPGSALAGALAGRLINGLITNETSAERLLKRGITPVLLPSHQFVGNQSAEQQLDRFYEAYRKSLAHLYE